MFRMLLSGFQLNASIWVAIKWYISSLRQDFATRFLNKSGSFLDSGQRQQRVGITYTLRRRPIIEHRVPFVALLRALLVNGEENVVTYCMLFSEKPALGRRRLSSQKSLPFDSFFNFYQHLVENKGRLTHPA